MLFRSVFIGRLSREKNVKLLLDSIKAVNKVQQITLDIIGDGGDIIIDKDLNSIVTHHGKLSHMEIRHILNYCDYLILPSYTEGIPFTVLESMMYGIPCIYSNINGATDVITNNHTGFLFTLKGYEKSKDIIDNFDHVFESVDNYFQENILNLTTCILHAYSININEWNHMSYLCKQFIKDTFSKEVARDIFEKHIHKMIDT